MHLLIFLLSIFFIFGWGKPVENAVIFLESQGINKKPIAHQITGESGKAAFNFLDEGSYRLLIDFPQQEGKWIEEKRRHYTITKASFNIQNKTYYYRGEEGYFSVKLSGLKRIDKENFRPVFRERLQDENSLINILDFSARRRGGQIHVKIKAITAKQFKKKTDKIEQDITQLSMPEGW